MMIKYYMLGKRVINLKGSKLGQILREDKTGFCRLDHISKYINYACDTSTMDVTHQLWM